MSLVTAEQKPHARGLPLATGRPGVWDHFGRAVEVGKYDLPMANIERAISLQHAGQNFHEVAAEEANERFGFPGLEKFTEPISWKKAELIAQYRREELERMELIELGGEGVIRKTAYFGGVLVSQALDPVNLAAMFVPIVNEHKFATLVTKHGLTKARAIAGITEAAVGAAMVEPFAYLSKGFGEQNEYSIKDTALSLVASVALGAGIRAIGGKIKDITVGKYDAQLTLDTIKAEGDIRAINRTHIQALDRVVRRADAQGFAPKTAAWKKFVAAEVKNELKSLRKELDVSIAAMRDLTPKTKQEAFTEAMNNLLYGEPVSGPQNVLELAALGRMDKQVATLWKRIRNELQVNADLAAEGKPPIKDTATTRVATSEDGVDVNVITREDTAVVVAQSDTTIEVRTTSDADPEVRAAIIKGQAEEALDNGKALVVDGDELATEATKIIVHGERAAHETPVAQVPEEAGNVWDEIVISDDHVDTSTPERAHESAVTTAEQINKQAAELQAEMKTLAGEDYKLVLKIAESEDVDPVALARAASTDSTLLTRIEEGQVKASDAVEGKEGIKPKKVDEAAPKKTSKESVAAKVDSAGNDLDADLGEQIFEASVEVKPDADIDTKVAGDGEPTKVDTATVDEIMAVLGTAPEEVIDDILQGVDAPNKLDAALDGIESAADCIIKGLM